MESNNWTIQSEQSVDSTVFAWLSRNLQLLSFGNEEEDETGVNQPIKSFLGTSSHDLINDPKLSSVPAVNLLSGVKNK